MQKKADGKYPRKVINVGNGKLAKVSIEAYDELGRCVAIIGFNGCEKTKYPHKYRINNSSVAEYAIHKYRMELEKMDLSDGN